jgi:hypothetical protein
VGNSKHQTDDKLVQHDQQRFQHAAARQKVHFQSDLRQPNKVEEKSHQTEQVDRQLQWLQMIKVCLLFFLGILGSLKSTNSGVWTSN